MKIKQTNYLEKVTNRFVKELRRKILEVQTLEPQESGISKITFVSRVRVKENDNGKVHSKRSWWK